jgi:GNAT superfamily N-acetyltransferase
MKEPRIAHWAERPDRVALEAGIEAIFFETAAAREFASLAERQAFRERWLGRYLAHDPGLVIVALDEAGAVAGYLVGSLEDPARTRRFADIGYFATFADLTARYPAHLHVNVGRDWRNAGLGAQLVAQFLADARAAGVPGVHVVTGSASRNRTFYERAGFRVGARTAWNGREVVFLVRELD